MPNIIDGGFDPVSLAMSSTLWSRAPGWAFDAWAMLEQALLSSHEDWGVWTDWYESRLKAGPNDQDIEVARVAIPDRLWNSGPEVVNSQIRTWLEERGIWRHATTHEPEKRLAEAEENSDLQGRLASLPVTKVHLIGARVALRSIPLLTRSPLRVTEVGFTAAALSLFGAVSARWFLARFPNAPTDIPQLTTALLGLPKRGGSDPGLLSAFAGVAAAGESIDSIAHSIAVLFTLAEQADGRAGGAAFRMATYNDLEDLADVPTAALAGISLWPGRAPPEWMTQRWNRLSRDLLDARLDWDVWVEWYQDRLGGRVRFTNDELAYIQAPSEAWLIRLAEVNRWIRNRLAS